MTDEQEEKDGTLWKGRGRILLMDDEEFVLEVGGELLAYLGFDAVFARDGLEALNLYQRALREECPFTAVIMDLTVPGGMGGRETIKRLLEIDPWVKAILSSGYSNDPVMANFVEYGFVAVAAKPYKIETLSEILRSICCREKP